MLPMFKYLKTIKVVANYFLDSKAHWLAAYTAAANDGRFYSFALCDFILRDYERITAGLHLKQSCGYSQPAFARLGTLISPR